MKINKIKSILTIILLAAVIVTVPIANALTPDSDMSKAERRHLAKFPSLTLEAVFDSSASTDIEEYLLDNFFLRDGMRTLTASVRFDLLRQLDNSGIYIADGSAAKLDYVFREDLVQKAAQKIESLYETYIEGKGCRVFFSVIPDKSCYTAAENNYPSIDYYDFERVMCENVTCAEFIPIFDCLDIGDYYKTDSHWSQDKIGDVIRRLGEAMDFESAFDEANYEAVSLSPFYGVYYGQSALPLAPDTLVYLKNAATDSAAVFNVEKNKESSVYTDAYFDNVDAYDVFLDGACALITIENPNAASERELIIFRDSFGSSLAPLLVEEYAKITLVDIRYMVSGIVGQFVEFDGCDVLFIWSTTILNNSSILR